MIGIRRPSRPWLVVACAAATFAVHGRLLRSQSTSLVPVTGGERIAWDQMVPAGAWVVGYQFFVYVDDVRQPMTGASCAPAYCTQCGCSASLPKMSAGVHRLEIVARDVFGRESARSDSMYLSVSSGVPQALRATGVLEAASPATASTNVEKLAGSLDRPSSIAVARDGRVFVADHSGVLVWSGGKMLGPAAVLDDAVEDGVALVDVTLHPDFAANSRLFVAYTARDPNGGFSNRIVRYREVGGVLGERAAIFEDRVPRPPRGTPRIRFGPDARLYVLFPDGADQSGAASYSGKILRLNEDGTTPADSAALRPVLVDSPDSLVAFDWQPTTGALWVAGVAADGTAELQSIPRDRRSPVRVHIGAEASAMAFYAGGRISEFAGQLLVAAVDAERSRRFVLGAAHSGAVLAMPFDRLAGVVTDLVVGPDGAVYYSVVDSARRGHDGLYRMTDSSR